MNKIRISGEIVLRTGMTVAAVAKGYTLGREIYESKQRAAEKGEGKKASEVSECTVTQKMPVIETRMDENGDPREVRTEVPIFPANGLRGQLRRHAAKAIEKKLVEKKKKLSMACYHVLNCGAATGSPAKGVPSVSDYQKFLAHPYMGLFGGGPYLMPTGFRADTLFMKCRPTVAAGIVPPDEAAATLEPWKATHVIMTRRVDDALTFRDPMTPEVVIDYENSVNDWIEFSEGATAARKEEKKKEAAGEATEKTDAKIGTWTFFEAVAPGARFHFNIETTSEFTSPAHIGLLIRSVKAFVDAQAIGGWIRNGFGRFTANLQYETTIDGETSKGSLIRFEPATQTHQLTQDNPIAVALTAWDNALDELTPEGLEALCYAPAKKGESD